MVSVVTVAFHNISRLVGRFNYSTNILELLREMPKEPKHLPLLTKQRQERKARVAKYQPAIVNLQVLGTGDRGAPRSLFVYTDHTKYLFNCGEGSQRLAHEHKLKLSKLEHLFFTTNSWENVGGVPGVALTIQDVGVSGITLHCPIGMEAMFRAGERFIVLRNLKLSYIDSTAPTQQPFQDNVMKVEYTTLSSDKKPPSPIPDSCEEEVNPRSAKRPRSEPHRTAACYICKLHAKPGQLIPEKCFEQGVPVGPLYGQLKSGQDITLEDGRVVRSQDVSSPDDPGPMFVVVECPDESYLDSLDKNPKLSSCQSDPGGVEVVVHFTPIRLTRHAKYSAWMERFGPETHHLMLGIDDCGVVDTPVAERGLRGLGSSAVHRIQYKLNLLHPEIFPLLADDPGMNQLRSGVCQTLFTYHLRPKNGADDSGVPLLTPAEYVAEPTSVPGFSDSITSLRNRISNPPAKAETTPAESRRYPKITFLGTGSCIPNKTRNTSAILAELAPDKFTILDCGEGTYGQLLRLLGPEQCAHVLRNTNSIFISHIHADHHIGLIGLLNGRRHAHRRTPAVALSKLRLFIPGNLSHWLRFYSGNFDEISDQFEMTHNKDLLAGADGVFLDLEQLGMSSLRTAEVDHCPNAFGVSMTTRNGFKLTYSGDTMPCRNLIDVGVGSDLLIHEATMEDGMEAEAKLKTHSTTSQAIEVGRQMGAKFTILTHFSQRYSKIPVFSGDELESNVGVAFDNMRVDPSHFAFLPMFIPALQLMFAEHVEEMKLKTSKRRLREERAAGAVTAATD